MKPVVTVEEMKEADRRAPVPEAVLIERAGTAVAMAALRMLAGSAYGKRVVVVAGKGNNGADGRVAARVLASRGAHVRVLAAQPEFVTLPPCDLAVDAAYGTGFRGSWPGFDTTAPVLSVDIPSGVHGDLGTVDSGGVFADATVTFAAHKPGLLFGAGPERAGVVTLADIGLPVGRPSIHLVEDADVHRHLPSRPRVTHKWETAVAVVGGSPGMLGAPGLVARGAMRAGAGYVLLGVPGAALDSLPATEAVGMPLVGDAWDADVLERTGRVKAMVVGPGLGRSDTTVAAVRRLAARAGAPLVLDADGINAIGGEDELASIAHGRPAPTVITPHDGEFARLTGAPVGDDRIGAARAVARRCGVVVLLKGPTTVVAAPDGTCLLVASGSPALATAGSGDVLGGIIGAFLASGLDALRAAAFAAHAHGAAARTGLARGLVAGDIPDLVAHWLSGDVGGR